MSQYDTLVLSGGSVKGFCLLGAIQALIDKGLFGGIKNFIGTSVGSIICYLICIGYSPIEIVVALHTNRWLENLQYLNITSMIDGNGATSFSQIHEALEKLTIDKIGRFLTLGKLRELYGKTLICTTYNMTTCHVEYLDPDHQPDLPCLTALRMSANIPLVFDRFKYMDSYYIDGGLVDNFPILKGEEIGEKVIGLYLEIPDNSLKDCPEDGILTYFLRLLQVPIIQFTKHRISQSTEKSRVISIQSGDMRNIIEFNVKSKVRLDMFSRGYETVMRTFQEGASQ